MILTIRLAFDRNQVVLANPSKSGGDWWYGSLVKGSAAGFFPNTYVQKYETCRISLQIIICVYPADFLYPQLMLKPFIHTPPATLTSFHSKKVTISPLSAKSMRIGGRRRKMVLCLWFPLLIWKWLRVSFFIPPHVPLVYIAIPRQQQAEILSFFLSFSLSLFLHVSPSITSLFLQIRHN